ncbi:helix-turn-helix transcriptional regulator [Kiloniella laminariae]|uniref:helix-turn-helix transcriptional regulator n=1 Tax=Kiloniella laminariae TaxID=454162 RepID=UPI00036F861A|nr:PAS domain-containing protein [Kiloniella laminariae]
MSPELQRYVDVCEAIAKLFQPYVEVVLHDLESETAAHIANNFSHRELGEPSLLHEIDFRGGEAVIGPYEKVNWDGRRIKSISVVVRNDKAKAIGVLCINMDVSHFHQLQQVMELLSSVPQNTEKPEALFKEDWHERINEFILSWTWERGVSVETLTRQQKRELVEELAGQGGFSGKNSANYVARILNLGRATIYNYLKDQKEKSRIS